MKKQISPKIVSLVFAILVVCFAIGFYVLAAWTEPTTAPPGGNVPAPLNVSGEGQAKEGGLVIRNSPSFINPAEPYGLIVRYGNVGIGTTSPGYKLDVNGVLRLQPSSVPIADNGVMYYDSGTNKFRCYQNGVWTDCIGAGGSGITSLSAGTGITLNPNPITSTGTISSDTTYLQRRVIGTCAANQAIRVVNSDGTVTCVNLPPSAICTWSSKTYSTGAQCCGAGGGGTAYNGNYWQCEASGAWHSTDKDCWMSLSQECGT